ncbi:hypothetical protein HYY73_04845 [Candidatus Woesearchaeota archaeon]|nr:hypothetical protein [Candidatus Woesearchaeota archaeon]
MATLSCWAARVYAAGGLGTAAIGEVAVKVGAVVVVIVKVVLAAVLAVAVVTQHVLTAPVEVAVSFQAVFILARITVTIASWEKKGKAYKVFLPLAPVRIVRTWFGGEVK